MLAILCTPRRAFADFGPFEPRCFKRNNPAIVDCDLNGISDHCERYGVVFDRRTTSVPGLSAAGPLTSLRLGAGAGAVALAAASKDFLFVIRDPAAATPTTESKAIPATDSTQSILQADLTGDGIDDILLLLRSGDLLVVPVDAGGQLGAPRVVPSSSLSPYRLLEIVAGPLGPSGPTVVFGRDQSKIWMFRDLLGAPAMTEIAPEDANALFYVNVDRDPSRELIQADYKVARILALSSAGPATEKARFPLSSVRQLKPVDYDDDGDVDFLSRHEDRRHAVLYRNDSLANFAAEILADGGFIDPQIYAEKLVSRGTFLIFSDRSSLGLRPRDSDLPLARYSTILGAAAADLNGDGSVDLAGKDGDNVVIGVSRRHDNAEMAFCDVDTFTPSEGGNDGFVTMVVHGIDMHGASVQLEAPGMPTVFGADATASPDGSAVAVTFDLRGAPFGTRDVVVQTAGRRRTLPRKFQVEPGNCPPQSVSLIGPGSVRTGAFATVSAVYTNSCNTNQYNRIIWIEVPANVEIEPVSPIAPPPSGPTGVPPVIPIGDVQRMPIVDVLAPPGATHVFKFRVRTKEPSPVLVTAKVTVLSDPPPGTGGPTVDWKDCLGEVGQFLVKKGIEKIGEKLTGPDFAECAKKTSGFIGEQLLAAYKGAMGELAKSSELYMSFAQMGAAAGGAILQCAQAFGKQYPAVKLGTAVFEATGLLLDGYQILEKCSQGGEAARSMLQSVGSRDPNDLVGPAENCGSGRVKLAPLPFTVRFENAKDASAAARRVEVRLRLSEGLEGAPTRLLAFNVGGQTRAYTGVAQQFLDLRPFLKYVVAVRNRSELDAASVEMSSFDPTQMVDQNDPTSGFLPPNKASPEGEGSITFQVTPRGPGRLRAEATIVFDANASISTNVWEMTAVVGSECAKVGMPDQGSGSTGSEPTAPPNGKTCGCSFAETGVKPSIGSLLLAAALWLRRARARRQGGATLRMTAQTGSSTNRKSNDCNAGV